MPIPTALGASPKTSKMQISPERCGSSSIPTIQTEAIERGLSSIPARTSSRPRGGVRPHRASPPEPAEVRGEAPPGRPGLAHDLAVAEGLLAVAGARLHAR